jgi:carboxyl-terminal processing protease
VPAAFLLDARTGYVRVTTFDNDRAADDLHDALARLEKGGMRRLVLDLRDNPGGLVKEAAKAAGEFLPRGAVVYTQGGRKADLVDTGRVGRSFWSSERRYPTVVMVNAGTASAAELVAGALQDHDRALVVGRPSFGKSLLMQGFPLSDGSALYLVVGRVRTPCGRVIQRQYRGLARQDYYHLAGAERDTAGRPSCRTSGGRTVYGGGGIYPDLLLPDAGAPPAWLARLGEQSVLLRWASAHVAEQGGAYPSLDALAERRELAPGALESLRRFAAGQGAPVPEGAAADALLRAAALRRVADVKWGDAGYYRVAALLDADVARAAAAFEQAAGLLR